jgi:purine-cytosine permease-like protein
MRSDSLARRMMTLAVNLTLGLALAATVAACSSSASTSAASSGSGSAPASAPASVSASASSTFNSPSAVAAITATWEKFFDSSTSSTERVALLQNGSTFSAAIQEFASLPLASGIGAKVTNVTLNSPTSATVTYNITSSGTSLLSGQKGAAVFQSNTWKVGDASLCALFKLIPGGTVPSACSSVS